MSDVQSSPQALPGFIQTGVLATILVLMIAGLLIATFIRLGGLAFFIDWAGTFFMCATPFQIMMAVVWENRFPDRLGRLEQPYRGLVLTAMFVLAGAIIMPVLLFTVGQGILTPIFVHYVIQSVGISLLVIIVFGCWPVSKMTDNKLLLGLGTLCYCYLLNFVVFRAFYNYDFFAGAPFYSPGLDPNGLFNGITALTFAVTAVALVMVLAMFEMWPVPLFVKNGSQPLFGLVGTLLVLLVTALFYGTSVFALGMEPMDFMVRGPVCVIFGAFLVDNLMQFQLFARLKQPLKGFAKTGVCLIGAVVMYHLYALALPLFVGHPLGAGPEANYAQEIWIATAMLGITFPVINIVAGAFDFWPIKRSQTIEAQVAIVENG
jgi:hypothetical protein